MNVCERVVKSLLLKRQEIAVLPACLISNNISRDLFDLSTGCGRERKDVWKGADFSRQTCAYHIDNRANQIAAPREMLGRS